MYSYFQYTTGQLNKLARHGSELFLRLDSNDKDAGRFWLKLIAGLRIHFPNAGRDVLNFLVDDHSIPTINSIKNLSNDLRGQQVHLMLKHREFVSSQPWWQQTQTWLQNDGWLIGDLPTEYDLVHQSDQIYASQPDILDFDYISEWIKATGEWLMGIHWLLDKKEFEEVGDILEQHAEQWLGEGFDPLELLFWLREIPSVLLTARPILCWLAAKACKQLDLPFLVNYYINAAENSLASFTRFSRDPKQWSLIELNETGVTIGDLNNKLSQLK